MSRIKAFKSGVGDLDDLKVAFPEASGPVATGFKLVAEGLRSESRLVYPKISAVVETWASGLKAWSNGEQDIAYKVAAHPVRSVSFVVTSEVTSYREFTCTIKATLLCSIPEYLSEISFPVLTAFFKDQLKKPFLSATFDEIYEGYFAPIIENEIVNNGLDPNAVTVTFEVVSDDPLVRAMFSEDGETPSLSGTSRPWAVLTKQPLQYGIAADLFVSEALGSESASSIEPAMVQSSSNVVFVSGRAELAKDASGKYYSEGFFDLLPVSCLSRVKSVSASSITMSEPVSPAKKADIVWVVDGSGSMADNQQAVADNADVFISTLVGQGADVRLGVVAYCVNSLPINTDGSDGTPGNGSGQWTTDVQAFRTMVTAVGTNRDDGSTENGMAALRASLTHYTFRPDARKYFIVVTDEDADDASTMSQTVQEMLDANVVVYAIYNPSEPTGYAGADAPPAKTGGSVYSINSPDWGQTLAGIAGEIAESFTNVKVLLSTNGSDYVEVEPLGTVEFSSGTDTLYIRFVLKSPRGDITPTVSGYTFDYETDSVTRHVEAGPFNSGFYVTVEGPQLLSGSTVREHLSSQIEAFAADAGVDPSLVEVRSPAVNDNAVGFDSYLSADGGLSSSSTEAAKPYGRYSVSVRRYSGIYTRNIELSSLAGAVSVGGIIFNECVLRDEADRVYPPLAEMRPFQAYDVPYTLSKTSDWPASVAFADGSTFTYNNMQPVVVEVLGSQESGEEVLHVSYPLESSAPLPSFSLEPPAEYAVSVLSAGDNAVLCLELPDGSRTPSSAESALVVANDPQARVVAWIPRYEEQDVPWESPHLVGRCELNGEGAYLSKKDGTIEYDKATFRAGPDIRDIRLHTRVVSAVADEDVTSFVNAVFVEPESSVIGPFSYSEFMGLDLKVRVSSSYGRQAELSVPYVAQVYESGQRYLVYPGQETLLARLPLPALPPGMLPVPEPVLRAVPDDEGVRLYVRKTPDMVEVFGALKADEKLWHPLIHRGYYYFNDEERYLFAEPRTAVISPLPSVFVEGLRPTGAPVIVEDPSDESAHFRPVHPDVVVREEIAGTGAGVLFLAYTGVHSVEVEGPGGLLGGFQVDGNRLVLGSGVFEEGAVYRVSYRLDKSFAVEYVDGGAILTFDRDYHGLLVTFEGSSSSPYLAADEVSLNPLVNPMNAGFLRLTDTEYPVREVELVLSPEGVEADGISPVNVIVRVLDSNRNPLQGKEVVVNSAVGGGTLMTDQYGGAALVLKAPSTPGDVEVSAWCEGVVRRAMLRCY